MTPKKRRQRRQDRLNQATLEDIIRENPDLFRGGNVNLLPEAEVEGTYGEVNQRRRRRKKEFIEDLPNVAKEVGFELARMAPILGDAIDVAEVRNAARTGKDFYGEEVSPEALAGIAAAGLLVPNIIEKPGKAAFKAVKNFFKRAPDVPVKVDIPNRTGFGDDSKWNPGLKYRPESEMNDVERAYHGELNRLKNEIDTEEGRKRVKDMIMEEVRFLEADPNTPENVRKELTDILYDKDLQDMKVQEVFYGGRRNKGFMNTGMKPQAADDRANYSPFRNAIEPDSDLMSADHEVAHAIQHNILDALGIDTKRVFKVGERVDLQKQGFRSYGGIGTSLDRDILKGVQMTDDPSLLRPISGDPLRPRAVKTYAEEGFDLDKLNPDNPRSSIRFENASRGHRTNEPYPILAGDRRMMIEEGILPSRHTPVTEEMIERFRSTPMGTKGITAPTDFQSPTTRSFANRRMAELMNRMPVLIPALAGAGYLSTQRGEQRQSGF